VRTEGRKGSREKERGGEGNVERKKEDTSTTSSNGV